MMGHEVQFAINGLAPDIARTYQPDIIILDIGLPAGSNAT
jgi:DNA-binding NarL/FixJ family response regulator